MSESGWVPYGPVVSSSALLSAIYQLTVVWVFSRMSERASVYDGPFQYLFIGGLCWGSVITSHPKLFRGKLLQNLVWVAHFIKSSYLIETSANYLFKGTRSIPSGLAEHGTGLCPAVVLVRLMMMMTRSIGVLYTYYSETKQGCRNIRTLQPLDFQLIIWLQTRYTKW